MAYKNKIYVCFDADEDMNYYKIMKMWKENDNIDYDFNNAHELNTIRKMTKDNIKRNRQSSKSIPFFLLRFTAIIGILNSKALESSHLTIRVLRHQKRDQ